jgi:hypothetical protein
MGVMDDATARQTIQDHADAVVSGDMDHVIADFSEELRPQAPEVAKLLPRPVEAAEVLSIEPGSEEYVALIRYSGGGNEVTIRSHWQDRAGTPQIVHGEPA